MPSEEPVVARCGPTKTAASTLLLKRLREWQQTLLCRADGHDGVRVRVDDHVDVGPSVEDRAADGHAADVLPGEIKG